MLYYNITPIIRKRNSYFFLTFWQKIVTTVNSDAAATTIEGPEGVSNANEKYIPKATDVTPKNDDNNAIPSGDTANCRAVAAGIIKREEINSIPTDRIDTATTMVIRNINNKLQNKTFTPSACAKSSCKVISKRDDQFNRSNIITRAPPM